jgi:signal transduction histidine kinase
VGNAVTHGQASTPITVNVDGSDEEVVTLQVHNEGSIPSSALPTIFDPFERGRDQSKPRNGLGLGLYIVNQLALGHGGTVTVASNEVDGTTFTCILPRS